VEVIREFDEMISRQPKRSRRQRLALGSVVREREYGADAEECDDSGLDGCVPRDILKPFAIPTGSRG
jgi:hypothetical protein